MVLNVIMIPSQNSQDSRRLKGVLAKALKDVQHRVVADLAQCILPGKLLFAVPLGEDGLNFAYLRLLSQLRRETGLLRGSAAGILIDGQDSLFTKSTGVQLAFTLNQAGCALVGSPLVEATGNLKNFTVLAQIQNIQPAQAYVRAVTELAQRVVAPVFFDKLQSKPGSGKPRLLAVHASSREVSNSLSLWQETRTRLAPFVECGEIGLRNGSLDDCSGCQYSTCLHFGENNSCFYGGVLSELVFPALRSADALMMICPNYNDAMSANLTAFVNRLTALFRQTPFFHKALFAIVVSGYSGGDMVAGQLISGLNMNKSFYLPANFALLETANAPLEALTQPGIEERLDRFSHSIIETLCMGY